MLYNETMDYTSNAIDFNQKWNYVLQWLYESELARMKYQEYCYRVNLAMEGKPWKNVYQEEIESNLKASSKENQDAYKKVCTKLPEGRSHKLYDAVKTIANQMSSGVDTYECEIFDPYMIQEPDTVDKLEAMCRQDYIENHLGMYASLYSRDLMRYGLVAVMCRYNQKLERNEILRINPKNTWWDTMYNSTGQERFRGYSTMIPWRTLKKMVEDDDEINLDIQAPKESIFEGEGKSRKMRDMKKATYSKGKIRTLNDLDIYVNDLNELASSPNLQGSSYYIWEYAHDLQQCYNLDYYRTLATNPKAQTKSGYHGQDVELTVLYDLNRGIEFKIINRRFVISINKKAFKRKIVFDVKNPITGEHTQKLDDLHLQCPLKFYFEQTDCMSQYPYPVSPLFNLLDTHDQLCGWRAKREHVSQILSILRIITNGGDADTLRGVLNIMGVVINSIQGDIKSLNLPYSYDPIDSQIAIYEQTIQDTLSAYTQFDAMQLMGDRASAAESGMAIGAIAQGLASHQNTLMELYADIARQCIMNRVIYSNMSQFPVVNRGFSSVLTVQELALNTIIDVKPKFAKQVLQKQIAANAMAIVGNFKDVLPSEGLAYFIEQAMFGNIPRGLAQSFLEPKVDPQALALAQQQAQNEAMALQQNQQMYLDDPIPYETEAVMQNNTPEQVDEIITNLQTPTGSLTEESLTETSGAVAPLDMVNQDGSMALNMAGQTSDLGSMLANSNTLNA